MRTTISIHDELLQSAKLRARERGLTLGALVEDALRRELSARDESAKRVEIPVFDGGTGPHPGLDLDSNRAIAEFLDDGVPLDKRR
ncbi:MAG TPA: CopG family transcriptional regulator [Solirubrobacteraceae bacterium]|nr:CopG family transcriptional regulator [Solirubrobacteraceae bacterium]